MLDAVPRGSFEEQKIGGLENDLSMGIQRDWTVVQSISGISDGLHLCNATCVRCESRSVCLGSCKDSLGEIIRVADPDIRDEHLSV